MVQRLATGIRGLDPMLKGGLPKGSMTLLLGPPGTGKTTIALEFLLEGLRNERPSVEVLTFPSDNLKMIAEGFEWELSLLERLVYLDLFSLRTGAKPTSEFAADPHNLSDVSITLGKALEARKASAQTSPRLVVDSLSDIFIQVKDTAVVTRFLQSVKQKLATFGVTTIVLVEQGMHDDQTITQIEFVCDGTIILRQIEEERQLSIKRMVATPAQPKWIPYTMLTGIDVKAEAFLR